MAKTRRKKLNRSPIKNQQINLFVVEEGARIACNGHRMPPKKMSPNAKAKPVFVGRVYTGVNKGKEYPYASAKRGGAVQPGRPRRLSATLATWTATSEAAE